MKPIDVLLMASSAAVSTTINVPAGGTTNLRTLANAAGYTGTTPETLIFEVSGDVLGTAGSTGVAAGYGIDTGVWPVGANAPTIRIKILGGSDVLGGGGQGAGDQGPATNGSDAIYCRVNCTIENYGTIKAGGGGGSSGSSDEHSGPALQYLYPGGSGGGGAPNGAGGLPIEGYETADYAGTEDDYSIAVYGGAGSPGTVAGGGAGGDPSSGTSTAGGAGGTYATAGEGMSAGNPGYAIRKNGNTVTVINSGTIVGTQG
jgi:hypothetical protein